MSSLFVLPPPRLPEAWPHEAELAAAMHTSPGQQLGRESRVWKAGKLTFRADFDSANLAKVHATANEYQLWTSPDCAGTPHETPNRTWFYFGVTGAQPGDVLPFVIMNLNAQSRLYGADYRPFYRSHPAMAHWERCRSPALFGPADGSYALRWAHRVDDAAPAADELFFAFCVPFSYEQGQAWLESCEAALPPVGILYRREVMAWTLGGRRVDLITITDDGGAPPPASPPPGLCPPAGDPGPDGLLTLQPPTAAELTPGRAVFFVSSRVHPGETPGSHMFNGLLGLLLRPTDPRSVALRRAYVFKLVPMLNPDGVAEGHYRTDTRGKNLNRHYGSPSAVDHPAVAAVTALLTRAAADGRLEFYIDLHAHANKRGAFAYGNALPGDRLASAVTWARLVSLNCPHFDFGGCNFSARNMASRDKHEDSSKEGAGRVALYKSTGEALTHFYTVEVNYNASAGSGPVAACTGPPRDAGRLSPPWPARVAQSVRFGPSTWGAVGRSLAIAALDLRGENPCSRLPNGPDQHTSASVKAWVTAWLRGSAAAMRVDRPDRPSAPPPPPPPRPPPSLAVSSPPPAAAAWVDALKGRSTTGGVVWGRGAPAAPPPVQHQHDRGDTCGDDDRIDGAVDAAPAAADDVALRARVATATATAARIAALVALRDVGVTATPWGVSARVGLLSRPTVALLGGGETLALAEQLITAADRLAHRPRAVSPAPPPLPPPPLPLLGGSAREAPARPGWRRPTRATSLPELPAPASPARAAGSGGTGGSGRAAPGAVSVPSLARPSGPEGRYKWDASAGDGGEEEE